MRKLKIFIAVLSIGLAVQSVYSQTVTIDSTFGQNGMTVISNTTDIRCIDFDTSGNIIAVGGTVMGFERSYLTIAKTNADGIIDSSFGTNGVVIFSKFQISEPLGMKITNENKIFIAVAYNTSGVAPDQCIIMQFNENGSLDSTFGNNGEVFIASINSFNIFSVNLENDDFWLIGQEEYQGQNQLFSLLKCNYQGEIDSTFGENGKVYLTDNHTFKIAPYCTKILNDHSVFVAGYDNINNFFKRGLAFCKLKPNGDLDTNFVNNGIWKNDFNSTFVFSHQFNNAIEDDKGNIALIGFNDKSFMCRFDSNGVIDSTFGINGFYYSDSLYFYYDTRFLQNGDKYLIGRYNRIISVNNDGTLDPDFANNGLFICEDYGFSDIKLQGKNKIILGGTTIPNYNFVISRLSIPLKANAGGNQHFCFEGGDLKQIKLGGKPTASGGTTPYTYRWWSNSANLSFDDTTVANPSIVHSGGVTVWVEVTDSLGNTAIDSAVISMSDIPYIIFDAIYSLPVEHHISQGDSVWITTDTILTILGNSMCRWNPIKGLNNSNICNGFWAKPNVTTSYYLTVIDEYGCAEKVGDSPIHKIYVDDVGIKQLTIDNGELKIYPNPTNGKLTISLPNPSEGGAYTAENIEIYNIMGQLLQSKIVNLQSKIVIDVSHLTAGVYFIKFDGYKVEKFVKY